MNQQSRETPDSQTSHDQHPYLEDPIIILLHLTTEVQNLQSHFEDQIDHWPTIRVHLDTAKRINDFFWARLDVPSQLQRDVEKLYFNLVAITKDQYYQQFLGFRAE